MRADLCEIVSAFVGLRLWILSSNVDGAMQMQIRFNKPVFPTDHHLWESVPDSAPWHTGMISHLNLR
jgi:hypothetical protein